MTNNENLETILDPEDNPKEEGLEDLNSQAGEVDADADAKVDADAGSQVESEEEFEENLPDREKRKETVEEKKKQVKRLYVALSLLVAVCLWFYVVQTEDPVLTKNFTDIPVNFLNEDSLTANNLAVSEGKDMMVKVIMEGKRADIANLSASHVVATADLKSFTKGENYVPVDVYATESVHVQEVRPIKIKVTIEDLVTVEKNIKVVFAGDVPKDKQATNISTTPIEIPVTGAKSLVSSVSYLKAEIPVEDLSTVSKTIKAELVPCDKNGNIVEGVTLDTTSANVKAQLYQIKEVPLEVPTTGSLSKTLSLVSMDIPSKVKIIGSITTVNSIESVTASPIDLSNISTSAKVKLSFDLPENVTAYEPDGSITANIVVAELPYRTFEYATSQIGFRNLTQSLYISLKSESVKITAYGSEDVISGLTKEDFKLYVNCEGIQIGDSSMEVFVEYTKPVSAVLTEPKMMAVGVSAA